jgi:hypothetical protein
MTLNSLTLIKHLRLRTIDEVWFENTKIVSSSNHYFSLPKKVSLKSWLSCKTTLAKSSLFKKKVFSKSTLTVKILINFQISCYLILYVIANLFGIYHQHLTSISQDDAYKNTIMFIHGRIQLETEKRQQVSCESLFTLP